MRRYQAPQPIRIKRRLLMILIFLLLAVIAFDLAALRWGVDTTDGGDHARRGFGG